MCRRSIGLSWVAIVTGTALCALTPRSHAAEIDILIIPARSRVIALAFDVHALRGTRLISYRSGPGTPLLHYWDAPARHWRQLTVEEYSFGKFMPQPARTIYLVGTDAVLPAAVIEGAGQGHALIRIQSVNIADIVNVLNQTLKFTTREWRDLAQRHGLETRDENHERRRWGRFGKPGSPRHETIQPQPAGGEVQQDEPPDATTEEEPEAHADLGPAPEAPSPVEADAEEPWLFDQATHTLAPEEPEAPVAPDAPAVRAESIPGIMESIPVEKGRPAAIFPSDAVIPQETSDMQPEDK